MAFGCLFLPGSEGAGGGGSDSNPVPIARTDAIMLNGPDWKLGSFALGDGEHKGVFRSEFDDSGFRAVTVPGEVQLQIGLKGMDLYYQSKELTQVNE